MDDSGLRWRLVGGNDPDIQGGSCHVFDSGGHTLIVDCGSRIGDDGRLWVPDIDTDLARASAIALTHGHPDHICGLASALARRVHCPPVYGTPLTLALFDDACNRLGVSASVRPVCHVLSSDGAVDLPGFRLSAYPV
ncbi:MAG: MBL fold metallo-hydrolase, partial [Pseudomonadota bacterium]|nr:MBL fold metallo-hydrolase [Pseudomonadota bacterium]